MTRLKRDANAASDYVRGLTAFSLRQEARETWQYIVTDKLVQGIQHRCLHESERRRCFVGLYLDGKCWFELICKLEVPEPTYFSAVLEIAPDTDRPCLCMDSQMGSEHDKGSMLIFDIEAMDEPERVGLCKVPSVIRLKPLHFGSSLPVDTSRLATELASRFFGVRPSDWMVTESRELNRGRGVVAESPGNVIKARPQVVNKVADIDTQSRRERLSNRVDEEGVAWFGIGLAPNGYRARITEGIELSMEHIEVFLRPFELQPYAFERLHEL